jgi:hypothetical protein
MKRAVVTNAVNTELRSYRGLKSIEACTEFSSFVRAINMLCGPAKRIILPDTEIRFSKCWGFANNKKAL